MREMKKQKQEQDATIERLMDDLKNLEAGKSRKWKTMAQPPFENAQEFAAADSDQMLNEREDLSV